MYATQNQELSRSPLVNPFDVSQEVIFTSRGSFGFLEEWGILEESTVSEKKVPKGTGTFYETVTKL